MFQHVSTGQLTLASACDLILQSQFVLCLIGNSSPHKPQAFGQVVERSSLAQLIPKWYVILTLGWIQNIKNAIEALHVVFLMFDYVWQVEIIADDAPIEDGECSCQRFSELDSTIDVKEIGLLGFRHGEAHFGREPRWTPSFRRISIFFHLYIMVNLPWLGNR